MSETVLGLNDLLRKFEKLKNLDFQKAIMAGMDVLKKESEENSSHSTPHVVTGLFKGSYSVEPNDKGGADLVNSAPYSIYLEQKFGPVRKAFDEHNSDILEAIKNNLEKQIKEV